MNIGMWIFLGLLVVGDAILGAGMWYDNWTIAHNTGFDEEGMLGAMLFLFMIGYSVFCVLGFLISALVHWL